MTGLAVFRDGRRAADSAVLPVAALIFVSFVSLG
jgi:hypothetical protein